MLVTAAFTPFQPFFVNMCCCSGNHPALDGDAVSSKVIDRCVDKWFCRMSAALRKHCTNVFLRRVRSGLWRDTRDLVPCHRCTNLMHGALVAHWYHYYCWGRINTGMLKTIVRVASARCSREQARNREIEHP